MKHILHEVTSAPWAMEPRTLALAQRLLLQWVGGRQLFGAEIHAELGIPMPEERDTAAKLETAKNVRVAVVPIVGTIMGHANSVGTSARDIEGRLAQAMASKNIDAVLLDIDSPGGVVTGIPELADTIAAARRVKPMGAYNSGMMASAAYWLGAAAGDITATASSMTGSIGVYTWHEDHTAQLEKDGVKLTEISAGEFKTEGAPWKALTEEAMAHEQAQVDHFYGMFVKSVAENRRDTQEAVRAGYGQGRVETAPQALRANLIDRVGSFDTALARLVQKVETAKARGKRAAALRAHHLEGID